MLVFILGKKVEKAEGVRELTGGQLGEFSELRSEAFHCQSHGSKGG